MKKVFVLLVVFFLQQEVFAQDFYVDKIDIRTVFDSILVANSGENCNQYYNRVMSNHQKYKNDLSRRKSQRKSDRINGLMSSYGNIFDKPLILVNNKSVMEYDFIEIQKFKKIKTFKFLPKGTTAVALYGANGGEGVFLFEAD
jgi:hypothetical protein